MRLTSRISAFTMRFNPYRFHFLPPVSFSFNISHWKRFMQAPYKLIGLFSKPWDPRCRSGGRPGRRGSDEEHYGKDYITAWAIGKLIKGK